MEEINNLTSQIIRAYYNVYNELGYGFLEKVYENSMVIELRLLGLHGRRQVPIKVYFKESDVGVYYADIIVEDLVIIELKAVEALCEEHELQLLNYLRATDIEYGLLLNFGQKPQIKRKVFHNKYKQSVKIS
ncbi:GxxExxY protein [Patescibacteria group bacterium]|nr:GxxExxY protein [Patescibacteria group bacterium]MBU1896084.1 GxxExxY protein [Patescibacteria group bacterium]